MLKKLLAAVAIFTGAAISSNAQDYHFAGNPIDSTTTGGSVVMFNYVTNTSTSDFTIKWKIIYVDNPNNWTITGFCDNINCFGDTATLQGALHTSNTIPPNNTPTQGNLTLDVEVPVDGSTGHLQVKVRAVNSLAGAVDTLVYNLNKTAATGVSLIKQNDARVTLSPNPANSSLVIFTDKSLNVSKINILNIVGQSVYSSNVTSEKSFVDVNSLAKGTYLVKVIDNKGLAVTTRKFIKN